MIIEYLPMAHVTHGNNLQISPDFSIGNERRGAASFVPCSFTHFHYFNCLKVQEYRAVINECTLLLVRLSDWFIYSFDIFFEPANHDERKLRRGRSASGGVRPVLARGRGQRSTPPSACPDRGPHSNPLQTFVTAPRVCVHCATTPFSDKKGFALHVVTLGVGASSRPSLPALSPPLPSTRKRGDVF